MRSEDCDRMSILYIHCYPQSSEIAATYIDIYIDIYIDTYIDIYIDTYIYVYKLHT